MNAYSEKLINETNELLQNLLGITGEGILTFKRKNAVYVLGSVETFELLKNCSDDIFAKVYQILHFYYPRWIAYNAIQKSDDRYKDFSSNNELLLALTSIIDWIANIKKEKQDFKKRFISFLEKNLSKKDLNKLINNFYIAKEKGKKRKLKSLKEFAEHIYKVRSLIVHNAELGGLYPFQTDFNLNFKKGKVDKVYYMITPKDFRLFLWKAIFNSLDLKVISEIKSYEN